MDLLKLYLLGTPRIERHGKEVSVDTRKATALLAYLALNPYRHSRDSLAALLWPENDSTGARAALRRTLSTLNRALNGVGLTADRETIEFGDTKDVWVDVLDFTTRVNETMKHKHVSIDFMQRVPGFAAQCGGIVPR